MKKFILSLVIMALGIVSLIGAALVTALGSFQFLYDFTVTLCYGLTILGIVATLYGTITAFIQAKK